MDIAHDLQAQQFSTTVHGQRGELDYSLRGDTMVIIHTGVPPAIGGRGVAAQLTRAALDTARREGWKVVPACAYAAAFIRRHPEYAGLVA